ncbi:mechanosensitive ion channel family protein [Microvirga rosea]|nr:mechanosensitive ion channel family protein [Microvirga rosea]
MNARRPHVQWLPAFARWALLALVIGFYPAPGSAQPVPAQGSPPPQVQEFVKLLDDPAIRSWLEQVRTTPQGPTPSGRMADSAEMASRLSEVRAHLAAVAAALPRFPGELRRASGLLLQELNDRGLFAVVALIGVFVALGYGSERLFWRATMRTRIWIGHHPMATVADRLRMIGMRLGFGLALVAIFGIGSIGAFLLFDWPPLLRQVVIAYLVAVVLFRLALALGRILVVPDGTGQLGDPERFRIVPMPTEHALFWHRRLGLFIGYWAFGRATVDLLGVFGFGPDLQEAAAYVLGLGLLGIGLEAVWRRPRPVGVTLHHGRGATGFSILLTAYGVLLWLLWVAGLGRLFWLGVVAMVLPKAIAVGQRAVAHLLRPTVEEEAPRRGVLEVIVERGLRTLLIVTAALLLADVWGIDLIEMTSRDTLATRLVRGALTSVVVLLLADFLWQVSKAAVDGKLADTTVASEPDTVEAVRQARLRTLLPIFRNILFVIIAVLAGLTALSALGVEIGPLIAGAGVFGVAVGFGAQTLVKDVISGIFYLLDDAFRVGEYIQSGSYKGTVESFSLRSVKLRHHRGPVYTVPFGQLGAVQNMSRDWVIDKFQINVTYGTDLEKARKLIKKIGQDLAEDHEFVRHIIEPLKMQGVEQFGDYAVQIRCKMTTKPGEQFVIRRKALARIKQAFDENGIQFATPTVQVSAGEESGPAAAQHVIGRISSEKPAAE